MSQPIEVPVQLESEDSRAGRRLHPSSELPNLQRVGRMSMATRKPAFKPRPFGPAPAR